MRILVIDVGGTHVKVLATGRRVPIKIPSGPKLTPRDMVHAVRDATADWKYDRVSIGYPGPVRNGKPLEDPWNLAPGWVGFDFARAFGKPIRIVNDAAMQALGSYVGGRMLFLGLGTGLGSALVHDGVLIPLELAHLPYQHGKTYEQCVGEAALQRMGKHRWRKHVAKIVELMLKAFLADYVVLGGGNVRHIKRLPKGARRGKNANAFTGGYRLWKLRHPV
jgi:predicted NBD/HSP70 family sugar kinase